MAEGRSSETRMLENFAISIIRTLHEHDHEAYLVGGCVRDLLLGLEPTDYDVATSATPNEVANIFYTSCAVGAQFGVILVPVPKNVGDDNDKNDKNVVEVATFRSDIGFSDGRHPDHVQFTNVAREDAARRCGAPRLYD
jgi:poly(A) polymerase